MYGGQAIELDEVREQAVRAELAHLMESASFRTSKRSREFLQYIVEHTIHGPTGSLKERSIGVDLFQLPQDFDPGQHTIVRVTANEVRKRLAQHYLAENGNPHPVRIELSAGSYRAGFRWEAPAAEAAEINVPVDRLPVPEPAVATQRIPPPANRFIHTVVPWVVAFIAIAGGLSWAKWAGVKPTSAESSAGVVPGIVSATLPADDDLRIIVGAVNPFMDRSGRTWGPDRFFSGGSVLLHPSERIVRTLDPDLYRHLRTGDFRYAIPLKPGTYELHLHFAETGLADFISAESSGEGQRVFHVSANGKRLLDFFDVVADANGVNTSDERVFRNIAPAEDGFLHLAFSPVRGTAMLSAIEVLPVTAGKLRPIRIRAGWTASWKNSAGQEWLADSFFLGGNALVRRTNPAQDSNSAAPDIALYASERWGNFSYALPLPEGKYRVTLKFCEGHYGKRNSGAGGVGSRLFDVYCNGVALMRNFDIFKEAGGEGRPIDRSFSGIRPNAQGKILLSFVPVVGMACVNAIEVTEDTR
uniref:Malectin domain-containing protein n=1 Tax=Solibacter usitatus (strain Ellin6076) TaxID=234267 RepID=Q01NB6_SOLUE